MGIHHNHSREACKRHTQLLLTNIPQSGGSVGLSVYILKISFANALFKAKTGRPQLTYYDGTK